MQTVHEAAQEVKLKVRSKIENNSQSILGPLQKPKAKNTFE